MAIKFTRALTLIILLNNIHFVCFSQNSKESLELQLSIEQDTVYPNEHMTLSFCLSTNRWFPRKIVMDPVNMPLINTDKEILGHGIYLCIKHHGGIYGLPVPPICRYSRMPLKYWISRSHPIILTSESYQMNHLFDLNSFFDKVTAENFYQLQNTDYGEYEFQGIYVSDKGDTLVSNTKKVLFMPLK